MAGPSAGQRPPKANINLSSCLSRRNTQTTVLDLGRQGPNSAFSSPDGTTWVKSCKRNKSKKEVKGQQKINFESKGKLECVSGRSFASRCQQF